VREGDYWSYWHFVVPGNLMDSSSKENMDAFKRHILLEFLDRLNILKYERGYDGVYYDISIRARD